MTLLSKAWPNLCSAVALASVLESIAVIAIVELIEFGAILIVVVYKEKGFFGIDRSLVI